MDRIKNAGYCTFRWAAKQPALRFNQHALHFAPPRLPTRAHLTMLAT